MQKMNAWKNKVYPCRWVSASEQGTHKLKKKKEKIKLHQDWGREKDIHIETAESSILRSFNNFSN